MEALSKKQFNNQIVLMRKDVKQAVVHQIHQLTKQMDMLRNKKGTEEQKDKNAQKAENLISEMTILRQLKPDEISLFALTNLEESELKSMLTRQIISPLSRALAKLCLRKNLTTAVGVFKSKYNGSLDLLTTLLDERCSQEKTKKKKNKGKKKGKKKSIEDSSKAVNGNEQVQKVNVPAHDDFIASESEDSAPQLVSENFTSSLDESNSEQYRGIFKTLSGQVNRVDNLKKASNQTANSNFVKNMDTNKINKSRTNKVLHFYSDEEAEDHKAIVEQENVKSKKKKKEEIYNVPDTKNVDPFFVTRDNKEYHTFCTIKKPTAEDGTKIAKKLSDEEEDSYLQQKNQHNRKGFDSYNQPRNEGRKMGKPYGKAFPKTDHRMQTKTKFTQNRNCRGPEEQIKLHPSWEAKKKLSLITAPFQGKKITFD